MNAQIRNQKTGEYTTKTKEAKNELARALELVRAENILLLDQLHSTQETLQKSVRNASKVDNEIINLRNRIDRLILRHITTLECSSIQVKIIENTSTNLTALWHVNDSYLAERCFSRLCFTTSITSGIPGIIFHRTEEDSLAYFNNFPAANELRCTPMPGSYAQKENSKISGVGSSDWLVIKDLLTKITSEARDNSSLNLSRDIISRITEGTETLSSIFGAWPKVLRYDSIALTKILHTEEYQSLEILVTNIQFDARKIPTLNYRLSSVNSSSERFGQHPRLEFHEDTKDFFDNWFVESEDDRGARLELRFSMPDLMDIGVWRRLSQNDQLLIAATISKLPEKISELMGGDDGDSYKSGWIHIAEMLKRTLRNSL
ncbi:hypothetical protein [Pseudomonas sp. CFBP 13719]|uniref:hypothetical protein n=1 Tax=Pseudomonas sp. CFBP 13719 TaxID=2775303 RepID=UPI00177BA1B3|nr:hypothetical protein [Pseudomonas sp. CFBP 13719]MBD8684814.1 hypothetical protein [Pseudomonas sp. CFBP 13719]